MRIVFMGTPDFAIPSLNSLISSSDEIIAVVTQPDRPKGRHGILTFPPVKMLAVEHGLKVYQPVKVKDPEFISLITDLKPDIIAVVAYGQILSRDILNIPPKSCINIHASLLPQYRGSSPINWAIMNGEKITGVTSMIVREKLDSGPILLQRKVVIEDDDTSITLKDKLAHVGGELLSETIRNIDKGDLHPVTQDESRATYFPMLTKAHGLIDWRRNAEDIRNSIRGLLPWPGAFTYLNGDMLKIFRADVIPVSSDEEMQPPGTISGISDARILVSTGKDMLELKDLQKEGKRRISASEFIRGNRVSSGSIMGNQC